MPKSFFVKKNVCFCIEDGAKNVYNQLGNAAKKVKNELSNSAEKVKIFGYIFELQCFVNRKGFVAKRNSKKRVNTERYSVFFV